MKNTIVQRDVVTSFLDQFLSIKNIHDTSWNGLQVEGKNEVKKIMFAVDAGLETFQKAMQLHADMIVVHHGHFWLGVNPCITGWKKQRIQFLLNNEISLYAAHLPLDKHPEVGNNAQLLKILGFDQECEFGRYNGETISFIGTVSQPKTIDEIAGTLKKSINAECKILPFGPKQISRIAVCSGGGSDFGLLQEAVDAEVDLYLTGDSTEMYHLAQDIGINVIFAGHHATETVGVKALADVVASSLGVETIFIDIPTNL